MSAPARVARTSRQLYRATGMPADVRQLAGGVWQIVLDGGRVVMSGTYTPTGGGNYQWDSTLEIDGRRVMNCEGIEHLAQILIDPEPHIAASALHEKAQAEPVEEASLEDAPSSVRALVVQLQSRLDPENTMTFGTRHGGTEWAIVILQPDEDWIDLTWSVRGGKWVKSKLLMAVKDEIHVIPEHAVEKVFGSLFGAELSGVSPDRTVARGRSGERMNSVEVRRSTVIRN